MDFYTEHQRFEDGLAFSSDDFDSDEYHKRMVDEGFSDKSFTGGELTPEQTNFNQEDGSDLILEVAAGGENESKLLEIEAEIEQIVIAGYEGNAQLEAELAELVAEQEARLAYQKLEELVEANPVTAEKVAARSSDFKNDNEEQLATRIEVYVADQLKALQRYNEVLQLRQQPLEEELHLEENTTTEPALEAVKLVSAPAPELRSAA